MWAKWRWWEQKIRCSFLCLAEISQEWGRPVKYRGGEILFSGSGISAIIFFNLIFNFPTTCFKNYNLYELLYNDSGKKHPFNRFVSECCWHGTLLHSTSKTAMNDWSRMYIAYMSLGALFKQDLLCKAVVFPLLLILECISEVLPLPAKCLQAV